MVPDAIGGPQLGVIGDPALLTAAAVLYLALLAGGFTLACLLSRFEGR